MGHDRGNAEPFSPASGFAPAAEGTWREKVEADLGATGAAAMRTRLTPRLEAEPVYFDAAPALPTCLRPEGPWRLCQEYDDPRMDATAHAIEADLAGGVQALWLRTGLDHGTRMLTGGDLNRTLAAADLAAVPIYLEPECDGLPLALFLDALRASRGVDSASLTGGLGLDPLGTLARSGVLPSGLSGARRDLQAVAAHCRGALPGMRAGLVSTRPYHLAGATLVQELAWALGTGVEYVRWLVEGGATPAQAARQLMFAIDVGGELFPQIAKLRALRLLWAKAVAAFGGEPDAQRAHVHVRTSLATRTQRDPWTNILRGTAETFVAAIGGADTIACVPFDAAIGPSDPFARRVARNTQLVLREEAHLGRVDDPVGGSWLVERLTAAFADEAWTLFQDIEAIGGMSQVLRAGKVAGVLDVQRKERRQRVARRAESIVGVSEYAASAPALTRDVVAIRDVEVELGNPFGDATPARRHDALLSLAEDVHKRAAPEALALRVRAAAEVGVDLFSLGAVLRAGRASLHLEPLPVFRPAAPWEALRQAADDAEAGATDVLVLQLGPLAEHRARLSWVRTLLAAGGLIPRMHEVHELSESSVERLGELYDETTWRVAVLCGADERYADAPALARRLRSLGAGYVIVAGQAADHAEALQGAGVSAFAHSGGDVLAILERAQEALGVRR